MTLRRILFWAGVAAAIALGVFLRLGTRAQVTNGNRVHGLTADDHYHLRRARFAVAHYPRTIFLDPLMDFPNGGVPIWPPLFDVALATPAVVIHGASAPPDAIEREAAWVPVVFAAGAILFAGLLGREIFGDIGGIVVALFVAVCPGHILWTQYAHTDQHVAESFFGLLVLWLFVASRNREAKRARWEIAAGVALALAVLAWQGALYWGAIFALSLFLEAVLTRSTVFGATVRILGLAAVVVALGTAYWLNGLRTPLTYISFGYFQPLFLASLAGGTIVLDTILAAARRTLTGQDRNLRLAAVAVILVAILPSAGPVLRGLGRGLGYVVGETSGGMTSNGGYLSYPKNWLKGIFEARPLLADGPWFAIQQLSFAYFLSPIVILGWALRAKRGERPGLHIALAVWGTITLLLSLSQRLNVYYAAPLAAVTLVETARAVAGYTMKSPARRALAAASVGLILAAPFAQSTPLEFRAIHAPGSDLFATLDWMEKKLPRIVDPYDPRLLSPPQFPPELAQASSVLAPWSLGHLILYESGLPVVANNFGYGFTDSLKFFLAESEEEALQIARRRRSRWVFATDLAPRMNDYASYIDRPPLLRVTAQGLVPTERYFQTLQSRLYDFDGAGLNSPTVSVPPLKNFRLLFHSQSAIPRGGRWLARWKIFEVLGN
jgi:dolichyl-diphosphooligosaccharide--protein glycosyltransferase